MSSAAKSAVAAVPLERGIEILERRLIELRADIDAILTQLASNKTATQALEPAGAPEPQAPEAIAEEEAAPTANGHSSDAVDQLAGAPQMDAIEPEQPSLVAVSPETTLGTELPSNETHDSNDLTAIASIDADPAEIAAQPAEMQVDPVSETAVMPIIPAASVEPTSAQTTAVAAPESTADSVPASTTANPDATVISLQSRQRKQKAGFSTGTAASVRPGRRLATKIAASIVALLVAGTMLVVADKAALGSAQSPPWMSPLPSYVPSGASWPFLGSRQAAVQDTTTADSSTSPVASAADDAMLSRYREAWPTSW